MREVTVNKLHKKEGKKNIAIAKKVALMPGNQRECIYVMKEHLHSQHNWNAKL